MDPLLLQKLPIDIVINHILPYTYRTQEKKHLRDIRSFVSDFDIIQTLYFIDYNEVILMYDLIRFCNNNIAPIYGIEDTYEAILKRHRRISTMTIGEIIEFVFSDFHRNVRVNTQAKIKFLWGLLKPRERTRFMNLHIPEN